MMYKQVLCMFKKELKAIFRDKKTLFFAILFPMIIVPFTFLLTNLYLNSTYIKEKKTVNISISDKNNILYIFLNSDPNVKVIKIDDVKTAFAEEIISFNIIIPDNFDQKIQEYNNLTIKIQTNSDNKIRETAILKDSIERFSSLVLSEHLKEKGLPSNLQNQIQIENENLGSNNNFFAISLFSMIIPLFLILFCCIGTSSTAADLTSGEK